MYIYIYVYICIYKCICVCVYVCARVCVCACMYWRWLILSLYACNMWHDSSTTSTSVCVSGLIRIYDMTHPLTKSARHDSFYHSMRVTCDITHRRLGLVDVRLYVGHDSSTIATWHATWLIHLCDMTHSLMRHDSSIYATWLIHLCDMTHPLRHDSSIYATWLIHLCDMTHPYIHVTWLFCKFWLLRCHR